MSWFGLFFKKYFGARYFGPVSVAPPTQLTAAQITQQMAVLNSVKDAFNATAANMNVAADQLRAILSSFPSDQIPPVVAAFNNVATALNDSRPSIISAISTTSTMTPKSG
jgi:hypothetical protein